MKRAAFGGATIVVLVLACSSNNEKVCTPSQSVTCTGDAGCSGTQICSQDGTGFGACSCTPIVSGGDAGVDATNDAPIDASSWTPKSLSGLVLWVDGSQVNGDGGSVTSWPDQSGNNDNLTPNTGASPTVASSAIGGKPALHFTAGDAALVGTAPSFATNPFVVEVVAHAGACSTGCTMWGITSVANGGNHCNLLFATMGTQASATFECINADVVSTTFGSGAHVFGFRRTGASAGEVRIDGSPTAMNIAGGESTPATAPNFSVGTQSILDADVAEVVVAQNASDADVTQLEAYLKAKYGL